MDRIEKARGQIKKVTEQIEAIQARAEQEDRDISRDEATKLVELGNTRRDWEARLAAYEITEPEIDEDILKVATKQRELNIAQLEEMSDDPKERRGNKAYSQAFDNYLRVTDRDYSEAQKRTVALLQTNSGDGAKIVPTEFERAVYARLLESNPLRRFARVFQTAADYKVTYESSEGSCTVLAEAATESADHMPDLTQVTIGSHKLSFYVEMTYEQMRDTMFPIAEYITELAGRVMGKKEMQLCFTGTGSSQPTGLVNDILDANTIVSGGASDYDGDDVVDLKWTVPNYHNSPGCAFALGHTFAKAIDKARSTTSGVLEFGTLAQQTPNTLRGFPYFSASGIDDSSYCAFFGDWRGFYIADRGPISVYRYVDSTLGKSGKVGIHVLRSFDCRLVQPAGIGALWAAS